MDTDVSSALRICINRNEGVAECRLSCTTVVRFRPQRRRDPIKAIPDGLSKGVDGVIDRVRRGHRCTGS